VSGPLGIDADGDEIAEDRLSRPPVQYRDVARNRLKG
jgi:hypothetical protein